MVIVMMTGNPEGGRISGLFRGRGRGKGRSCWGGELEGGGEEGQVEGDAERLVAVGDSCSLQVGVCVGEQRPPRSLPACFMNRMGAKLDAVS